MSAPTPSRSAELHRRAVAVLPGGNSRHTVHTDPHPVYAVSGRGCRVVDADGVERLDAINNQTSQIHGHGHPAVVDAIARQAARLGAVSLPTEPEIELAERLCRRVPSVERVRFANSGTEAVMHAVKGARRLTGRRLVVKLEGAYHGAWDTAQVSVALDPARWGDPAAPASVPGPGVSPGVAADVLVVPVDDPAAAREIVRARGDEVAAVLVDACLPELRYLEPSDDLLHGLREAATDVGALLIADEVFSFRLGYHGSLARRGVVADLTAFGKVIGGGLPVGALGGRADVMDELFDPRGRVPALPHAGTFNANPVTMAAGVATLDAWTTDEVARLDDLGDRLRRGLRAAVAGLGVDAQVRGTANVACVLPTATPYTGPRSLHAALGAADGAARSAALFTALLDGGVLAGPRGHLALSTAMGEPEVDELCERAHAALASWAPVPA